jgi:hypothetical protein
MTHWKMLDALDGWLRDTIIELDTVRRLCIMSRLGYELLCSHHGLCLSE